MLEGSSDLPTLFEGNENFKVPVCNPSVMVSGIMVFAGKIFSHALVQGQIGIRCLAPCIYEYLASGKLSCATGLVSLDAYFSQKGLVYFFILVMFSYHFLCQMF